MVPIFVILNYQSCYIQSIGLKMQFLKFKNSFLKNVIKSGVLCFVY